MDTNPINAREAENCDAFRTHLEVHHGLRVRQKIESHGIVLTDMSARRNFCLGRDNLLLVGEAAGELHLCEQVHEKLERALDFNVFMRPPAATEA